MSVSERLAARMVCVGFEGLSVSDELRDLVACGVSSVILLARNYESPKQLRELCHAIKSLANRPIMICVDHEGGRVQRFGRGFTSIPSMRELGHTGDPNRARELGELMARELRAAGIDMNLAPVLDVDTNPDNPVIADRSFGPDPQHVARMGAALIEGMQSSGLAACGKHFPGHGDTSLDSHSDLPHVMRHLDQIEHVELTPFRTAIRAGVAAVMTAHVVFDAIDPDFPATLSAIVIGDLLRQRLRFNGVVISDDLEMRAVADHFGFEEAVVQSVRAGVDLLLICRSHDLQQRAIDALARSAGIETLARERILEANRRLNTLFARFVNPVSGRSAARHLA